MEHLSPSAQTSSLLDPKRLQARRFPNLPRFSPITAAISTTISPAFLGAGTTSPNRSSLISSNVSGAFFLP
ncbi:MAG: hypothetical protein ACK5ZJ_07110 [Acidobacteriota bacterium]